MNVKKIGSAIAAAIVLTTVGGIAQAGEYFECPLQTGDSEADRIAVAGELSAMATSLRCARDGGSWDDNDPIWYAGKKRPGCDVHLSTSKLIDLVRTSEPPPRKKGNNAAQGAANDVLDGKDDSALASLQEFIDTLMYNANALPGKQGDESDFSTSAVDAQTCIMGL